MSEMPVTEKQKANLIPLNKRTQRERKEIATKGADASNKRQAQKKSFRECASFIAELDTKDAKEIQALTDAGISKDEMTQAMALTFMMFKRAKNGNSQMARLLMELTGQVKEQGTNVTVNNNPDPLAGYSDEELRSAIEELKKKV